MDNDLPLVIVNPASQGGRGGRRWPRAASSLRSHFGPFACQFTNGPGDATKIAADESSHGRRLILVFGGDGTISETANGVLQAGADSTELGIIPNGTGSDFVRSLGMPGRISDIARGLRDGVSRRIDVGHVRYDTGERWFLNSASFGLSGQVAHDTNRSRKSLGGTWTFATTTAKAALRYEPPPVELSWNEQPARRLRITTVSLHNGGYFGGGMRMAPYASLTDGLLDAVIIEKISVGRLLSRSPLLYAGAHLRLREVQTELVEKLEARSVDRAASVRVEVDGESPGCLPASFRIAPNALTMRLPRAIRRRA